jgi:hypothetical protein
MTRMQVIRADHLRVGELELVGTDATGTAPSHGRTPTAGAKQLIALHPPTERILLNTRAAPSRRRTQFSLVCHGSRSRYG